ncbi:MAG: cell envelope integrity protein CreD [bacterium]|nr:cell envelope integrity protein CreD [bacterium]
MSDFYSLGFHWLKLLLRKRNMWVLAAIFFIVIFSGHRGAVDFKNREAERLEFLENEASTAQNMYNYLELSKFGFHVLSMPAAPSVFFVQPPGLSRLSARINTVAVLDIYNGQGKLKSGGNARFRFRFSDIVLMVLTFLALYLCFESLRNKEYLKFLRSRFSYLGVYLSLVFSNFIFFTAAFLVLSGAALGTVLLHGISFGAGDFAALGRYLGSVLVMLLFFIGLGTLCGTIPKQKPAFGTLVVLWWALVFGAPAITNSILEKEIDAVPSTYKAYNDKQKIINDFEKKVRATDGEFTEEKNERFKELAEYYYREIFPLVEAVDRERKEAHARAVACYNRWSLFTVTTFCDLMAVECGGGNGDYLGFFDYLLRLRKEFLRFWIDRVYYNDPKKMVSFIQERGGGNVYRGRGAAAVSFWTGMLFNLAVVLILLSISFLRFKRYLHTPDIATQVKKDNPAVEVKKGEVKVLMPYTLHGLTGKFYDLLSRAAGIQYKGEPLRLTVDGVNFSGNGQSAQSADFLYVCHPSYLPRFLRVSDFISIGRRFAKLSRADEQAIRASLAPRILNRTFRQLENDQRGEVFLAVLRYFRHKIYLVDRMDVGTGMSSAFMFTLNDTMREWAGRGSSVLYQTAEDEVESGNRETDRNRDFIVNEMWTERVSNLKTLDDDEIKK